MAAAGAAADGRADLPGTGAPPVAGRGPLLATTAIAGIAAWVSYWHMAGVAARYGETGASPYLLPLSVDGLVIVASVSLVELAGRIRSPNRRVRRSRRPRPHRRPNGFAPEQHP